MPDDALPSPGPVAGVDVGGTFTDAVVLTPDGPRLAKVPTTPEDQGVGLAAAVEGAGQEAAGLAALAHGTTTATNAVLERALDRAVLLVTDGFADLLTIARQDRPSLYDLTQVRPAPAIPREHVVAVEERITVGGEVLTPLSEAALTEAVDAAAALDPAAVAICLLFSWADDRHEQALAQAVRRRLPEVHLTVSADLVGAIREYERASTCALNAAVGPMMSRYLGRLAYRLPDVDVTVMTSSGGTAGLARMAAEPVHTLLSGPAAGVVAAAAVAREAGFPDAVAFDMGGTSTDVCLIRDGEAVVSVEGTIDGLPIGTPTVGIHTVGAGGGSIAHLDAGGALQVGPRSAGADPGPAADGRGGTLPTVTDAHVVLGHVTELAGGRMQADTDAAQAALAALPGVTAQGILDVVRAAMARALRQVSTERGVDPAGLALVAYGGAGPLHASALARMLGCRAVVLPPAPGVLSAAGLLTAPRVREHARSVLAGVDALPAALAGLRAAVLTEGQDLAAASVTPLADLRYRGQAHELRITLDDTALRRPDGTTTRAADDPAEAFHQQHRQVYGYDLREDEVQVVTVRLRVATPALAEATDLAGWDLGPDQPSTSRTADVGEGPGPVPVVARGSLSPGDVVDGPAILTQPDSTAVLLPGDRAVVQPSRTIVVTHRGGGA